MKSYGIIGWPLGHTMSPTLHNWGFEACGIDANYAAWPVSQDDLSSFMGQVRARPISGLSVTIPHKQAIMEHLDRISERATTVGAVNTLYWDEDQLCGENTDVIGIVAPLTNLDTLPATALVLGAGGAARAALAGFKELGIPGIAIANRTHAKAVALSEEFAVECVAWEDRMDQSWALLCNTTPLGMSGAMEDATPWDGDRFAPATIAYDIVYNPLETRFLREARAAGCTTISGLEMFLHQGLAQFRLWTGTDMDESGARTLLLNTLTA
ncbi:shikimate dehydrogenase [Pseudodesulfovibrio sediminis]|uniref:Shikimate dehydrogenase (NADP(+)) n=1 Tax=Pseudodesulfovibrio sediminis TaxID=2810563 RepID=A0ABM7P6W3_9BACT|nr:shikimate dehydrogenase [Pseudodesulfovibrio sediminis]BCS88681.1 shikimate dehydrogenase (NADP(+)) [Pseudodesulfovibrio sediminis]